MLLHIFYTKYFSLVLGADDSICGKFSDRDLNRKLFTLGTSPPTGHRLNLSQLQCLIELKCLINVLRKNKLFN